MLTNGKTDTSYQDPSLQGQNRPHDKKSTVEKVEHIGRDETIFLSKFATKKKAINNQHNFMFRKVAESDRKPVAAVSGFKGGSKPKTQNLKNDVFSTHKMQQKFSIMKIGFLFLQNIQKLMVNQKKH